MQLAEITETIQLGTPVQERGIIVVPLFPRGQPVADYVTVDTAIPLGFRITEMDAEGAVPELRAVNPLATDVLLYDGEELLGAKQNRILNATVLIGAESETVIPVSCVEQGRWSTQSAYFEPARHTAYPDLRRRKAERLAAAPFARGRAQNVVWDEVRAKADLHGTRSSTDAQADIYRDKEPVLDALTGSFPLLPGQSGAVLILGNTVTLDWVSQPQAWTHLYPRLLRGYLLDALEQLDHPADDDRGGERFLDAISESSVSRRPSSANGDDLRIAGERLIGSGLDLNGELLQLCAFTPSGDSAAPSIARPSRRR